MVLTILKKLGGFKPELLADREVMLAAVEKDGLFLEYAAEELRADHDFVLKALKKNPSALDEAAESLRADRSFLLKAVKATKAWWLVHFAAPAIEKDANFVQRCREAAGTGLVFTYYHSSNCFFDMRQAFPAVGASVPGGTAYDEVMKQLREAIHGSSLAGKAWKGPKTRPQESPTSNHFLVCYVSCVGAASVFRHGHRVVR